jgi:hypothetical protein
MGSLCSGETGNRDQGTGNSRKLEARLEESLPAGGGHLPSRGIADPVVRGNKPNDERLPRAVFVYVINLEWRSGSHLCHGGFAADADYQAEDDIHDRSDAADVRLGFSQRDGVADIHGFEHGRVDSLLKRHHGDLQARQHGCGGRQQICLGLSDQLVAGRVKAGRSRGKDGRGHRIEHGGCRVHGGDGRLQRRRPVHNILRNRGAAATGAERTRHQQRDQHPHAELGAARGHRRCCGGRHRRIEMHQRRHHHRDDEYAHPPQTGGAQVQAAARKLVLQHLHHRAGRCAAHCYENRVAANLIPGHDAVSLIAGQWRGGWVFEISLQRRRECMQRDGWPAEHRRFRRHRFIQRQRLLVDDGVRDASGIRRRRGRHRDREAGSRRSRTDCCDLLYKLHPHQLGSIVKVPPLVRA